MSFSCEKIYCYDKTLLENNNLFSNSKPVLTKLNISMIIKSPNK